jgi:hypothetical protein
MSDISGMPTQWSDSDIGAFDTFLEAERAEFEAFKKASELQRAAHESRLAKITEERQKEHHDVVFPTFEEMKEVVELSRSLSATLDSTRDMAARHEDYMSSGSVLVKSEHPVVAPRDF